MTTHKQSYALPMTIIGALFFIFGFVTWVNGSLIPYLKIACQLETDLQSYLVATAFFIAYTVMAIPSSYVLRKTGYKKGMSLGLLIMAAGALLFIPAAQARHYEMFLLGLFIIGSGLAVLQTASNPYVSIIGPIESAAKRISIMGICNKTAGILSPLILGALVLKNATKIEEQVNKATDAVVKNNLLDQLAARVIAPYVIMSVVLVILAIMIKKSSLPEINTDAELPSVNKTLPTSKTSIF